MFDLGPTFRHAGNDERIEEIPIELFTDVKRRRQPRRIDMKRAEEKFKAVCAASLKSMDVDDGKSRFRIRYARSGEEFMVPQKNSDGNVESGYYSHERLHSKFNYVFVTIDLNGFLLIAFSRCSKHDTFNKKYGRVLAWKRMAMCLKKLALDPDARMKAFGDGTAGVALLTSDDGLVKLVGGNECSKHCFMVMGKPITGWVLTACKITDAINGTERDIKLSDMVK